MDLVLETLQSFGTYTPPDLKSLLNSPLGHIAGWGVKSEATDNKACSENGDYTAFNINNVEGSINWGLLEYTTTFNLNTQLNANIGYTSDLYEMYKEYIQSNFTGEEQDANMTKLHELISHRIERIADQFSDNIGNLLTDYAIGGEKDKLKNSVLMLTEESLSMKLAMSLVDFGIIVSKDKPENLYSSDDLNALGFMKKATDVAGALLSSPDRNGVVFTRDEFPAQFILYGMQKESIYSAFSVSDSVKDNIETVFFRCIDRVIDTINDDYATTIQELLDLYGTLNEEQKTFYVPFDKEPIWPDINRTVENMRSGMSAQEVLKKSDYYYSFFKDINYYDNHYKAGFPLSQNWQVLMPTTMVGMYNNFTTQLGLGSQFTMNGIDRTA